MFYAGFFSLIVCMVVIVGAVIVGHVEYGGYKKIDVGTIEKKDATGWGHSSYYIYVNETKYKVSRPLYNTLHVNQTVEIWFDGWDYEIIPVGWENESSY